MRKRINIFAIVLPVIIMLVVALLFFIGSFKNKVQAVGKWEYVNNLNGSYTIISTSSLYKGKGFDIKGGNVSTCDSNAPHIILFKITDIPQANQRFSFMPIETINGNMVYYITSTLDNNGRVDVKNGEFKNQQTIWFWNETSQEGSKSNPAQRWLVRSNDGGKTIQIVLEKNPAYVIGIGPSNEVVLSNDVNSDKTRWTLNPVCGTFGLNTRTFLLNDNIGYVFSESDERWRYLEPLSSNSRISDIIDVGVHGEGVERTAFNGVQAFSVPYNSKFYIDTSFVYSNTVYEEWKTDLPLGKMKNRDGDLKEWKLSNDTAEFVAGYNNKTHLVKNGIIVIEISKDNKKWSPYIIYNFTSNKRSDQWELGSIVAQGVYVRVSFRFEIYCQWTTGILFWKKDHEEYKNINEVSDSFYVASDGFGNSDFGVVQVLNLSSNNVNDIAELGCVQECVNSSKTLNDGSMTLTGFLIKTNFPNYTIEVSKNNGKYNKVSNGYSEMSSGKYNIRVTSQFGKRKEIVVYVCNKKDVIKTYFGKIFTNSPNETGFLQGVRILSGKNETLDSLGISLDYSFADIPVYESGCSINIQKSLMIPALKGTILYRGEETGEIVIDTSKGNVSKKLNIPGYYTATLSTSNSVGDIVTFTINWWVVKNAPGPVINELVLKTKSQEIYDLLPTYYGVQVHGDKFIFEENGKVIEKSQVIYYAFATYEAALSFALRVEKEYVMVESDGLYSYQHAKNPLLPLNEYELFQQMYTNAKANVKLRYFAKSNPLSIRIFTPYDSEGNVRKYDDGITETIAYCLEQNTNYCIVTTDKVELSALTSRQPFINDFIFISNPLDSVSVVMIDEFGKEYIIAYDEKVEDQLIRQNGKSGKYTVKEKSIYGDSNIYDVYYIARETKNDTVITLEVDNEDVVLTYENNGTIFKDVTYFSIKMAKNKNDNHGLLIITEGLEQHIYDINEVDDVFDILYTKPGTYEIKIEDRFGNFFEIVIMISEG